MLPVDGRDAVLWIHILAACVWVGGQITVAALMPLLRGTAGLAAAAGRRFNRIGWSAFAVLVVTGILNVARLGLSWGDVLGSDAGRTLVVKLLFVLLSGAAAAVHAFIQARRAPRGPLPSILLGSLSVGAAIVAALFGVSLTAG